MVLTAEFSPQQGISSKDLVRTSVAFAKSLREKADDESHGNTGHKIQNWFKRVEEVRPDLLQKPSVENFRALTDSIYADWLPMTVQRAVIERNIDMREAFPEAVETAFLIRSELVKRYAMSEKIPPAEMEKISLHHLLLLQAELSRSGSDLNNKSLIRLNRFSDKGKIFRLNNRILGTMVDTGYQNPAILEAAVTMAEGSLETMEKGFKAASNALEDVRGRNEDYFRNFWNKNVQRYRKSLGGCVLGMRTEVITRWGLEKLVAGMEGNQHIGKADVETDLKGIGDFFVYNTPENGIPEVTLIVETKTDDTDMPKSAVTMRGSDGALKIQGDLNFGKDIPETVRIYLIDQEGDVPVLSMRLPSRWAHTQLTRHGVNGRNIVPLMAESITNLTPDAKENINAKR